MGVIGERKLQELIDRATWEVANGTPQNIASRGLFEACAEVLEGKEVLDERCDELAKEVKEYNDATLGLRKLATDLLGEDIGYGDAAPEDLTDVYKALAGKIDDLKIIGDGKDIRIEELERRTDQAEKAEEATARQRDGARDRADAAEARAAELERTMGDAPKWLERNEYLETGLKRVMIELDKLRKGVL